MLLRRTLPATAALTLALAAPAAAAAESTTAAAGPSPTPLLLELALAAVVFTGMALRRPAARAFAVVRRALPGAATRRASAPTRGA